MSKVNKKILIFTLLLQLFIFNINKVHFLTKQFKNILLKGVKNGK